jgi:hypothetical protein
MDSINISHQAYILSKDLYFIEGNYEAVFLICKRLLEKLEEQAISLTNDVYGEEMVRLLLVIAESHVFHLPVDDKELLKALPLIDQAEKVSEQVHSLRMVQRLKRSMLTLHRRFYSVLF